MRGFIVKKAIAKINVAIHIRSKPKPTTIMSPAPINSRSPAVENKPTVVLLDTSFSDRLKKIAAIIANIQTIMKTTIAAATNGRISEMVMLVVTGVWLANWDRVPKLPFQVGYISCRRFVMLGRIIAIAIAMAAIPPTMAAMKP